MNIRNSRNKSMQSPLIQSSNCFSITQKPVVKGYIPSR